MTPVIFVSKRVEYSGMPVCQLTFVNLVANSTDKADLNM